MFLGFIITFNRPSLIGNTLNQILNQSLSPSIIWIIDNSDNLETRIVISKLTDYRIRYYHMGYNAGPAGAAAKGFDLCLNDGADWIFWGDDNDPPPNKFVFEELFKMKDLLPSTFKVGQIGMVGQRFNSKKGVISRVRNEELIQPWVMVDNIGGGQSKIINSEVIKIGVAPNSNLFFGFEELDFDLKMKKKGFSSFVSGPLMLMQRQKYNTLNKKKSKSYIFRDFSNWRALYSHRNLLFILWVNGMYLGFLNRLGVLMLRPFFNLRNGFKPFFNQLKFTNKVILGFIKLLNA